MIHSTEVLQISKLVAAVGIFGIIIMLYSVMKITYYYRRSLIYSAGRKVSEFLEPLYYSVTKSNFFLVSLSLIYSHRGGM